MGREQLIGPLKRLGLFISSDVQTQISEIFNPICKGALQLQKNFEASRQISQK